MKKADREGIVKAIKKFNKYRSPEAKAQVVSAKAKSVLVKFSGPFSRTCGIYDYFDDLKLMMEEFKVKVIIKKIEESKRGCFVEFELL